ncbi:MAG: N-acetylmuramoyl-L-alanine amidase, partial [Pseudomonadota bacterium]
GLAVASRDHRDDVRSILFDLIRRETANEAAQFRETLIRTLSKQISISRSPRRSAAFRVLKQLSTPAVLVELGYMSNPQDQRLMRTRAWQTNVAGAIAAAIRRHFR